MPTNVIFNESIYLFIYFHNEIACLFIIQYAYVTRKRKKKKKKIQSNVSILLNYNDVHTAC